MAIKSVKLTVTTDASGDGTATATYSILGRLVAVKWIDGDLVDGVDAVLSATANESGVDDTLLTLTNANADAWYHPRTTIDTEAGAEVATEYAPLIIDGTLKLVVSSGGNAKTGGCIVYYTDR